MLSISTIRIRMLYAAVVTVFLASVSASGWAMPLPQPAVSPIKATQASTATVPGNTTRLAMGSPASPRQSLPDNYADIQDKEIYRFSDHTRQVNIYVTAGTEVPGWRPEMAKTVQEAFLPWQAALGERIRFTVVDNPHQADVFIHWQSQKAEAPMRVNGYDAYTLGETNTEMWDRYVSKNDITIYLNNKSGHKTLTDTELYNALLHEIGHLLGITEHSPDSGDIMNACEGGLGAHRAALSSRDIATIQAIYRMKPAYTNPDGVHLAQFEQWQRQVMASDAGGYLALSSPVSLWGKALRASGRHLFKKLPAKVHIGDVFSDYLSDLSIWEQDD